MNPTQKGIALMVLTTFIFAVQDGMSRHLAANYNVFMVIMMRYWFFALFVVLLAMRAPGGVRGTARSNRLLTQIARGVLLAAEVCVMVVGFVRLGLVQAHALFTAYPLIAAALSGPLLGEKVGWRRWLAIVVGFAGVLVILRPGMGVFAIDALFPLVAASMFALYGLLTRYVSRYDSTQTSFFWTGVAGAGAITLVGVFHWQPMQGADWYWMGALCVTGVMGHYTLIRAYDLAEVSTLQPFAYFQLVFGASIGVLIFAEVLELPVVIGALITVSAGLFAIWRARQRARAQRRALAAQSGPSAQ